MVEMDGQALEEDAVQKLDLERLRDRLPIDGIGSTLIYAPSMGSTNQRALALLETHAAHGTLVVAEQQTEGRGRAGRKWVTRAGRGLAFSLIINPAHMEISSIGLLTGLGAVAVSDAILSMGLRGEIKWPNDVLVSGRKLAGVLMENVWMGARLKGSVLGIGVNLRPGAAPPEDQLDLPAIDLESALGYRVDATGFLLAVLKALADWWARLATPDFLEVWNARLAYQGRKVCIGNLQDQQHGVLETVDADGCLVLRGEDGLHHTFSVGEVHLRPQAEDLKAG